MNQLCLTPGNRSRYSLRSGGGRSHQGVAPMAEPIDFFEQFDDISNLVTLSSYNGEPIDPDLLEGELDLLRKYATDVFARTKEEPRFKFLREAAFMVGNKWGKLNSELKKTQAKLRRLEKEK